MPARKPLDVNTLEATLTNVRLPFGLTLDRVVVKGQGIHIDTDPFEFNLKSAGNLNVSVSSASISSFLNAKSPKAIQDFDVAIDSGMLIVKATAKVVVTVKVHAECALEIVDKRQLFVRLKSVGKLGPAVQKLIQKQLDDINPVLDVKDLPLRATLDSIELRDGSVHVIGSILGV